MRRVKGAKHLIRWSLRPCRSMASFLLELLLRLCAIGSHEFQNIGAACSQDGEGAHFAVDEGSAIRREPSTRTGQARASRRSGAMAPMTNATLILAVAALSACSSVAPTYRDPEVAMTSMATFDPQKYEGVWYEIARFPNFFQAGCDGSTATYQAVSPGMLAIENACLRNGETKTIRGSARVVGPGRLAVRLDGVPVAAPYWVLWVDQDYSTAVVGVPSGRAGWILNRSPKISTDRLNAAKRVLEFNGYDLSELMLSGEVAN